MKFYTNVQSFGDEILVRAYHEDKRVVFREKWHPTLFIPSATETPYRTLNGSYVDKIQPGTISECREFISQYKDTPGFDVYGYTEYSHQFIGKEYDKCEYDFSKIRIITLDIETECEYGFPDVNETREKVNVITLKDSETGLICSLGLGKFYTPRKDVIYLSFDNEKELLAKFMEVFIEISPDIVTGWNVKFFDMAYLCRRIMKLFDEKTIRQLSPFKFVKEKQVTMFGRPHWHYSIFGVSTIDYMDLYKKFTYQNQESYKLNHIAQVEVGMEKLDHSEFATMKEFYAKDFQKFVDYNIHDVELVDKLEGKLKLIELIVQMAYDAGICYEEAFSQVRTWDALIYNHLRRKNIVVPPKMFSKKREGYSGGFVKKPIVGMHDWVVSFDLNSLYPHLIMQYNISPETVSSDSPMFSCEIEELLAEKGVPDLKSKNISMAANSTFYTRDFQGFLPELMQRMYDDRVRYKDLMQDAQRENSTELIAKYNTIQMARKISLNSAYGALGNEHFRYFDVSQAEAITKSGQLSIRWIERDINKYLNRLLDTDNHDYVVAADTDSVYLRLGGLVDKFLVGVDKKENIVNALDKFCQEKLQHVIDDSYKNLAVYLNAYEQKMFMSREVIADRAVWQAKKRYILNVWDQEGYRYEEPKLKVMGIEAVKSSTPEMARDTMKTAFSIILNQEEQDLQNFVSSFRETWKTFSVDQVAFPRSVNGLKKYFCPVAGYQKGTPIQVKACLLYNSLLTDKGLDEKYPIVQDGEKIKFVYLKEPNPVKDRVIGMVSEFPYEFELDRYVDYETQLQKTFLDPLNSVLSAIGWEYEKSSSLEDFFG